MGFYENGSAPSGETVQGGTDFYSDGPAYSAIDPVVIQNFTKLAVDSAAASEVSNKASKAQADASAASASAAHASELHAADSDADATAKAGIATTQAGIATTKAGESATSAAASLASQNAAKTSETNAKTGETNAAASASTASTKASDASTSAAAALASQNAAKTSETNAKTSETNAATAVQTAAGTASPLMDGTATVGTGTKWAREDHKHPTDTMLAPKANPVFTGTPKAPHPAPGDSSDQIPTTQWVLSNGSGGVPATATPLPNGTGAVGVGTKYAREDHVHPTDGSRAPLDAQAFNNVIVNGGMEVSQEFSTAGTAVNGAYPVDCWRLLRNGPGLFTATQVSSGGPFGGAYLSCTVNSADSAMAASSYYMLMQTIEGYRLARMSFGTAYAQPIVIGFWTAHSKTGTFSGSIRNAAANRSYVFSYTQSIANNWEWKTIYIPGDTAGTWPKDFNAGLSIAFSLASGSTYLGAAGAWSASNFLGVTGTTNCVASTADGFRITNVIMLPGAIENPSALRSTLFLRPYSEELRLCQRYYQPLARAYVVIASAGAAGWSNYAGMTFVVPMRTVPTLTYYLTSASNGTVSTVAAGSERGWVAVCTSNAAGSMTMLVDGAADARL